MECVALRLIPGVEPPRPSPPPFFSYPPPPPTQEHLDVRTECVLSGLGLCEVDVGRWLQSGQC